MSQQQERRSNAAQLIENRWDASHARGLNARELLVYRSQLLGANKGVTNFGGGNTSAKIPMTDPLTGESVEVLWVKGSGGDLGTIKLDGFATLYMEKLRALKQLYNGRQDEDRMVGLYPHCVFNLNPRAPSIDTPLHGLIARAHVDHMHPDAVIAIAASRDSRNLTRAVWGEEVGWLPWLRPGFELALQLEDFVRTHPQAKGVVLEAHGLFTWGDSAKECYETTLEVINRAISYLADPSKARAQWVKTRLETGQHEGGSHSSLPAARRRQLAAEWMPVIRGLISSGTSKVGHFDDGEVVLEFVCGASFKRLASLGTSCPDHFLRTKIRPLIVEFDPEVDSPQVVIDRLPAAIEAYRVAYAAYYARCKHDDSPPMRDPNPVVYLIPGVGMITFAGDKTTARVAAEFYVNAINVMQGAESVSSYCALPEQEAFDIEYWTLEEAKLKRLPKPKPLHGRVAVITGAAGGIGLASARRLLEEGACIVLCDVDQQALAQAWGIVQRDYSPDVVINVWVDVTDEAAVENLYREAAVAFGGLDICVSNAGIASAAPIEETSLELWQRNLSILATGYFLVAREAVRLLKRQGLGGSIVFIGSKNALAASAGASAYSTAKAAELHLARCLALEGAPLGIRVNVVNPDAVLRGSRIWQGNWAAERARQYQTSVEELESVYRDRSLLKRSVYPEDVAEAVVFLASDRAGKSTGNILNVDAGNATAFTR